MTASQSLPPTPKNHSAHTVSAAAIRIQKVVRSLAARRLVALVREEEEWHANRSMRLEHSLNFLDEQQVIQDAQEENILRKSRKHLEHYEHEVDARTIWRGAPDSSAEQVQQGPPKEQERRAQRQQQQAEQQPEETPAAREVAQLAATEDMKQRGAADRDRLQAAHEAELRRVREAAQRDGEAAAAMAKTVRREERLSLSVQTERITELLALVERQQAELLSLRIELGCGRADTVTALPVLTPAAAARPVQQTRVEDGRGGAGEAATRERALLLAERQAHAQTQAQLAAQRAQLRRLRLCEMEAKKERQRAAKMARRLQSGGDTETQAGQSQQQRKLQQKSAHRRRAEARGAAESAQRGGHVEEPRPVYKVWSSLSDNTWCEVELAAQLGTAEEGDSAEGAARLRRVQVLPSAHAYSGAGAYDNAAAEQSVKGRGGRHRGTRRHARTPSPPPLMGSHAGARALGSTSCPLLPPPDARARRSAAREHARRGHASAHSTPVRTPPVGRAINSEPSLMPHVTSELDTGRVRVVFPRPEVVSRRRHQRRGKSTGKRRCEPPANSVLVKCMQFAFV